MLGLNRNFPKWDKTIKIDCGHVEDLCVYDKHNLPKEFDINYQNGKYNCRSNFFNLQTSKMFENNHAIF